MNDQTPREQAEVDEAPTNPENTIPENSTREDTSTTSTFSRPTDEADRPRRAGRSSAGDGDHDPHDHDAVHTMPRAELAMERSHDLAPGQVEQIGSQRLDGELMHRTANGIDGAESLVGDVDEADDTRGTSKTRLYVKRFLRNPMAVIGLVIFVVIALFGIFGGFVTPHHYADVDFLALATPPDSEHWFGTNITGNDLFAALAHGIQRSLVIGLVVSLATTVIAAVVGSLAAYIGGITERVVLEIIHFLLVIPNFLILALVSNSAGGDWRMLILVLVVFGWMFYARVVWTMAISLREREYVAAARYMGLSPLQVVSRHIIPNIGSLLTIHFTLGVVTTIQAETSLSFLGFGVKLPDVSLGTLISDGVGTLFSAPWMFWFPAITLTLLTVSMAFIADGLRDALDPNSAAGGHA
ncbi:ABC transporter permease [Propionibacteriaceae bacterium Y2011]